jgi:uncharacterized protein (DUF885 family)
MDLQTITFIYTNIEKMKKLLLVLAVPFMLQSCNDQPPPPGKSDVASLDALLDRYWEEREQMFPLEATSHGNNKYNNKLTITIAGSFRDSLGRFYERYLNESTKIDTAGLDDDARLSYDLFLYELKKGIEGLSYPVHLMPINQFWAFSLELPQLGSGSGNQPFKTVADYDNWLERLSVFPAWVDTAIGNMRKGIATGWVLPKSLVVKILPELAGVIVTTDTQSIFYSPVKEFPDAVPAADRERLTQAYKDAVTTVVNPSYKKLLDFFEKEYLPKSRPTSGINELPGGDAYYNFCIRDWTTTSLAPDSIYNIGVREVARMEAEMNNVKDQVGYKGSLQSFFKYISDNQKFFPFTKPQQIIDSFWNIKKVEDPLLKNLFNNVPKTKFTIRQTEAFRAASASAEYSQGSEDGSRPGIFYVPIVDPRKYNCVAMATLFLHEAIPGHHYQISLQQENKQLPAFRRFLWYGAYGEGWAHYCETLGRDLGLYDDPYQYFGHLSDGIHRAIRLVVDIGIHSRNMSREEAIKYMMAHELISEPEATAEIERYMALPGQALSYKIGQLTISSERKKYQEQMGGGFNIASFHDEVLKDGCVPLSVLRAKLEKWSKLPE